MTCRALYIADGSSDLPLARHLEKLAFEAGLAIEVVPVAAEVLRGVGYGVADRLEVLLAEDPDFDMVFVHRDAEAQDPERRRGEVREAAEAVGFKGPTTAVVPVRMTEAWLLLDEEAIRRAAGRPGGRQTLDLPKPAAVERLADPKQALRDALVAASGLQGRKLKIFRAQFNTQRRSLLEGLDTEGPIERLPAWCRLRDDVAEAVTSVA